MHNLHSHQQSVSCFILVTNSCILMKTELGLHIQRTAQDKTHSWSSNAHRVQTDMSVMLCSGSSCTLQAQTPHESKLSSMFCHFLLDLHAYMCVCKCVCLRVRVGEKCTFKKVHVPVINLWDSETLFHTYCYIIYFNLNTAAARTKATAIYVGPELRLLRCHAHIFPLMPAWPWMK